MKSTDYNELISKGVLFSIKDIDEMNLIKSDMLKKLIYNGEIEVVMGISMVCDETKTIAISGIIDNCKTMFNPLNINETKD